jgi:hypothetical protein
VNIQFQTRAHIIVLGKDSRFRNRVIGSDGNYYMRVATVKLAVRDGRTYNSLALLVPKEFYEPFCVVARSFVELMRGWYSVIPTEEEEIVDIELDGDERLLACSHGS